MPEPVPLQFVDSGYDEHAGELVLKVVNATDSVYPVSFRIDGARRVAPEGKVITLAAGSGAEENSFENPRKIYPVTSGYGDFDVILLIRSALFHIQCYVSRQRGMFPG